MRLTYANVMATLAMFVALGGTSYAVAKLPRNSVGSEQVRNRSLTAEDLAASVLANPAVGTRGPRGPEGPKGDRGPVGPARMIVRRRVGNAILGFEAGASVDVATMKLPAGSWVVRAETQGQWFPNQSPGQDDFTCALVVDGVAGMNQELFLGNVPGAVHFATFSVTQVVPASSTRTVVLRCSHVNTLPGGSSVPFFHHTTLVATEPGSLDVEDVTG